MNTFFVLCSELKRQDRGLNILYRFITQIMTHEAISDSRQPLTLTVSGEGKIDAKFCKK